MHSEVEINGLITGRSRHASPMQDIFFEFISPIFGDHKRDNDLHLVYHFSRVVFFFQVRCMKGKITFLAETLGLG